MKTGLAIALIIAGWTLVYTGFTEPSGNVLVELRAAIAGGAAKQTASPAIGISGTQTRAQ